MGVRYVVQRIGGEAHGEIFETELPLENASRGRALSAPPTASGTIPIPVMRLIADDGLPLIKQWHTAIYPVTGDDTLRNGYLVTKSSWNGQSWSLDLAGFTAYAKGQPFSGNEEYIDADPTDMFRDIWSDLQAQPDGSLFLHISEVTSPVRVGTPARQVEFTTGAGEDVSFAANDGARKLNWWSTFDCGREIDNLSAETPFDWMEAHYWDDNEIGGIGHRIDLGYPSLGAMKPKLRLVYGENVLTPPSATDNPEFATDVIVLGAGEGKDRVRGYAGTERTGLRRVKVIEDSDIDSTGQANARAAEVLWGMRERFIVDTVVVERHPNADIDTLEPGDVVQYHAETEQVTISQWVKIVNIQESDSDPDRISVTVVAA